MHAGRLLSRDVTILKFRNIFNTFCKMASSLADLSETFLFLKIVEPEIGNFYRV